MKRRRGGWVATAALLAGVGCTDRAPVGQVIALIGDEDLTRRDVAAELQTPGSPARDPAAAVALLIDRKLLAAEARERRLDRSPEYLAAVRRHREALLAALLVDQLAADLPPVSAAEAAAYVRARPWMFERRTQVRLDEIVGTFDAAAVGAAASLDAVAARLRAAGARFDRHGRVIDSAALPQAEAARILGAPIGTPLLLQAAGPGRMAAVLAHTPTPLTGAQAIAAATRLLAAERVERAVQQRIEAQRRRARIAYQQGFGPAAR